MIGFNHPYMTGEEIRNITEAHEQLQLAGDGLFTKKCQAHLDNYYSGSKTLITNSCTAALEMAAQLICIDKGDEIIMPSFTFVSTSLNHDLYKENLINSPNP